MSFNEHRPGLKLAREAFCQPPSTGPNAGPQAEAGTISQSYRIIGITSHDDGRHRAEELFVESRHAWSHPIEDRRRIEEPRSAQRFSAEQHAGAERLARYRSK